MHHIAVLILPFHLLPLFPVALAFRDDFLSRCADARIFMVKEGVELLATLPEDPSVEVDAPFHVAQGLLVFQLLTTQSCTFATQMPFMALSRELFVRTGSAATPAEVATTFLCFLRDMVQFFAHLAP